ncbi:MAG: aldo/keto reductase [Candidatus Zipacnadales bacterium]
MLNDQKVRADIDRREFMRRSVLGMAGASLISGELPHWAAAQEQELPKIPRRVLGRTKLEVSEISFGSFGFQNSDLLSAAINAGMNLIDTSPNYQDGTAERAIGQVVATRREEIVLMTKWIVHPGSTKSLLLSSLAASLERLQTSYVDVIHVGLVDRIDQLEHPAVFEAFEEAKAAGKVRFLGLSAHGGNRAELCEHAIHDGRFDMLCVKHNFGEANVLENTLKLAKEKNLGVIVFKVKAGAKPEDVAEFAPEKSFELAAAKWALQSDTVHSVCVGVTSYEDIKLYASACGLPLDAEEQHALEAFGKKFAVSYCRYCGTCAAACANHVAVADIMRYRMYAESYGMRQEARRLYARLTPRQNAKSCLNCAGDCLGACPNGLNTRQRLIAAHQMLA